MKEGIASIALLPCGTISGHFIQMPSSICYGLHGTGNFTLLLLGANQKIWSFFFVGFDSVLQLDVRVLMGMFGPKACK